MPSCLGGGDLDGDLYNLISLKEMPDFTPKRTHRAGEYVPAPKKMLDHPSTMRDVAEFVMEYINSDVCHLPLSLKTRLSDFEYRCLGLSQLTG